MVIFPRLLLNNGQFKQAWNGLMRRIQTTVEHMRVTNTEVTAMVRGHVVALGDGQRQAVLAGALAANNTEWVGIVTEPIVASGTGIARIDGFAYVMFEDNLTVASGEAVYVSETPGLATNVAPTTALAKVLRIGTIGDDTMYVIGALNACGVWLQHPSCPVALR